MDVSRNGAQRSGDERNRPKRRPARIHAQKMAVPCAEDWSPLRKGLESSAQRTGVPCAKDYASLRNDCRRYPFVVAQVVAAGDYVRAKLRCAPFFAHIHRPYPARRPIGCIKTPHCKIINAKPIYPPIVETLLNPTKLSPSTACNSPRNLYLWTQKSTVPTMTSRS
jgi:hypothetical protein